MFLHLKVYVNSFLGGRLPLFIVSVEFLTLLQTNFSCFLYVTLVLLKFFFFLNFILASLPSSILCRYIKRRFFLAACFLSIFPFLSSYLILTLTSYFHSFHTKEAFLWKQISIHFRIWSIKRLYRGMKLGIE